jgi:hypothetical protein
MLEVLNEPFCKHPVSEFVVILPPVGTGLLFHCCAQIPSQLPKVDMAADHKTIGKILCTKLKEPAQTTAGLWGKWKQRDYLKYICSII